MNSEMAYCHQGLGVLFVMYHLLFRYLITDRVWRVTGTLATSLALSLASFGSVTLDCDVMDSVDNSNFGLSCVSCFFFFSQPFFASGSERHKSRRFGNPLT